MTLPLSVEGGVAALDRDGTVLLRIRPLRSLSAVRRFARRHRLVPRPPPVPRCRKATFTQRRCMKVAMLQPAASPASTAAPVRRTIVVRE